MMEILWIFKLYFRPFKIPFDVGSGGKEFQTTIKVNVRVWNPTVANLT